MFLFLNVSIVSFTNYDLLNLLQGDSFRCVTFENVGTQIIMRFWH